MDYNKHVIYLKNVDNMKQKWKPTQYIEISIDEIFAFQDHLDRVKNNPENVWDVVDDFFTKCENELELNPNFISNLKELDEKEEYININLDDMDIFAQEQEELIKPLDIIKAYQNFKKKQQDIPFAPRIGF